MLSLLLVHLFKLHLFLKLKFWLVRQANIYNSPLTKLNSKGNTNEAEVSSVAYLLADTFL